MREILEILREIEERGDVLVTALNDCDLLQYARRADAMTEIARWLRSSLTELVA